MKFDGFFGFYLFAFVLPLPVPLFVSSLAMGILLLNCVLLIKRKPRFYPLTAAFLLFFLSDGISLLFSNRGLLENTIINDVKMACAILPFTMSNLREDLGKVLPKILKLFALGVFLYILYCGFYYLYFIYSHPRYTVQIDNYLFWAIENRFPGTYHRTYIGAYIVFSSILINYELFKTPQIGKKIVLGFLFLLLTVGVLFLGSKLTVFLFLTLNGLFFAQKIKFLVIPFLISFGIGLFFIKEWVMASIGKSFRDRVIFFNESIKIIQENLWWGIGEKNISSYQVLIEQGPTKLVSHNIFLRELLSNGILGTLFLLFLLIYPGYIAYKNKHLKLGFFMAVVISIGFIEDFIYLQRGLFFFLFFVTVFLAGNEKEIDFGFFGKRKSPPDTPQRR